MRYALFPESHVAHEAAMAAALDLDREDYPAPEVRSDDPWPHGVALPGPVETLKRDALGWGWRVVAQYSRGRMPHATHGRPGAVKDAFGLRFGGHPRVDLRACAVYRGGTWESVWVWGPGVVPVRHTVTTLRTVLRGVGA